VHPSLHESGGWVCLEAMAAGRAVICLDHGGPGTQVTPEAGTKVPARDPESAVRGIASAMAALARDELLRRSAGAAGRSRVRALFAWDAKGEQLSALYHELAGGRPCR
jgi:glycosyltransferase involved in cell wall biosynthesis